MIHMKTWVAPERVGHRSVSVVIQTRMLLRVKSDAIINYARIGLNQDCAGQTGKYSHLRIRACGKHLSQR